METQENKSIDKRLLRIERWLKRCMVACRCGSWSSALMEIECMEAEAREFRDDLWKIAENEAMGKPRPSVRSIVAANARVVVLAMVFVMSVGFPLSVDQDRPFQAFSGESIALLTSTESDILDALRESLSEHNTGRVILTLDRPEISSGSHAPRGAAVANDEAGPAVSGKNRSAMAGNAASSGKNGVLEPAKQSSASHEPAPAKKTAGESREPSVEDVISLIQVGQRALRTSEPAVKVLP